MLTEKCHSMGNTIKRQDSLIDEKNSIKYKNDDDELNSNLVIRLDLSQETVTISHGAYEQDVIRSFSSGNLTSLSDDNKTRSRWKRESTGNVLVFV